MQLGAAGAQQPQPAIVDQDPARFERDRSERRARCHLEAVERVLASLALGREHPHLVCGIVDPRLDERPRRVVAEQFGQGTHPPILGLARGEGRAIGRGRAVGLAPAREAQARLTAEACGPGHNGYPFIMGSTIVCAFDSDDEGSRRPLEVGADLAGRLGLPLVVAYIASSGSFAAAGPPAGSEAVLGVAGPGLPYPYPIAPDAEELDKARDEARRRVEQQLARWGVSDAQVEVALDATVADGLRRIAADRDAELLVVGSRGRGSVRAALLGSTSHALVGDAPCPVVVVPASG